MRRGELVAILGKTGCGKSTTFGLISGLIRPSRGRVAVQGHDPYGEFNWFRGKIGIVFQNDRLMPWRTALENVALGMELNKVPERERRDIAAAWLARLGLSGHENDYPHALSGGMRQRVSIARAFAAGPALLLCDEPFSALDEHTGNALRQESAICCARPKRPRSSSPIRSTRRCNSVSGSWCSSARRGSPSRRSFRPA